MTISESGSPEPPVTSEDDRVRGLVGHATVAEGTIDANPVECEIPVEGPFDGERVGALPAGGDADVDLGLERAEATQWSWAERTVAERVEIVLAYDDLVVDHQEEPLDVVRVESGKALCHGEWGC